MFPSRTEVGQAAPVWGGGLGIVSRETRRPIVDMAAERETRGQSRSPAVPQSRSVAVLPISRDGLER